MSRPKCIYLAAFLALASSALAQTDSAQSAPADPPAWSAGPIEFSGLVDAYYSLNFGHPASGTNVIRNFDVRANSFSLNMAKLVAEHSADPVGFRIDLGLGRAFDIFHATEPFQNGTSVMRNIQQAYISLAPPNAGGFTFDFGKFNTSAGAEPTETHLNFNYSRALIYANGPYYHFGARMSKPVNKYWTTGLQIVNGWNNVEDNNGAKTFGFTQALNFGKVSVFNNYYVGNEKPRGQEGLRHFVDTVVSITPNDKSSFYINYDHGQENYKNGPAAKWDTIGLAARFQVTDHIAFSPRYEWYDDKDGFITGQAQALQEFTLTGEYKIQKGFLARLEYRRDWSDKPFFDRGNEPGSAKSQDTLLLGFVVYFGPK